VTRADGSIVHAGAVLAGGEEVAIKFGDQVTRQAVIEGAAGLGTAPPPPKREPPKPKAAASPQGDLF
jgi:exodeoxyribonuclease VII large subunit